MKTKKSDPIKKTASSRARKKPGAAIVEKKKPKHHRVMSVPLIVQQVDKVGCHIFIKVKWKSTYKLALVDTGATHTVFDRRLLKKDIVLKSSNRNKAIGINAQELDTIIDKVTELKIRQWSVPSFTATFINLLSVNELYTRIGLKKFDMIIGSDILLKTGAVIDYAKRELHLNIF